MVALWTILILAGLTSPDDSAMLDLASCRVDAGDGLLAPSFGVPATCWLLLPTRALQTSFVGSGDKSCAHDKVADYAGLIALYVRPSAKTMGCFSPQKSYAQILS